MSENLTNVIGYFNPHDYPIVVQVSEVNVKTEVGSKRYITDPAGRYINDPVFEKYCHAKGLARTTTQTPVPIYALPRTVRATPAGSVTQAKGFVRDGSGKTIPSYDKKALAAPKREVSVNSQSHVGMSVEEARKRGLIGKARLLPEDYGADERTDGPVDPNPPKIKYSIESQPKIKSSSVLRPELMEADEDLPPEEQAKRHALQQSLQAASKTITGDEFRPETVKPTAPTQTPVAITPAPAPAPAKTQPKLVETKAPTTTLPKPPPRRRLAAPIKATPAPPPPPAEDTDELEVAEVAEGPVEPNSGVIQSMGDEVEENVANTPPEHEETGKRYICGADGKPFVYRSELERYVKRRYPSMYDDLMKPYPVESTG